MGLFLLSFFPKTYRIDEPVADWHSWRQADTAAVTRNFIKEGFTPLFPKFDSYYALNETGAPNPNRYFFAEFPLYNSITYPLYRMFGVHELYARLISIVVSSLTTLVLYLLVKKRSGMGMALLAAIFYAILPYNWFYGRVILADPLYILFSVTTLYLVTVWNKDSSKIALFAGSIAWSLALLTKPYALVLALPIAYLFYERLKFRMVTNPLPYLFAVLALVPFFLWRYHINQYPEGMFGTTWLYNQGNIRFTGAYFRWLIFDRMNRLIFATGGFILFVLGIAATKIKQESLFYLTWLAAIAVYFVIIAKGNVTHDYYQMPLVPVGCIFMASAVLFLVKQAHGLLQKMWVVGITLTLIMITVAFGWYEIRGYFNINHPEIVDAGRAVDELTPKDAKVIAPYEFDSAFLYQTNRYGWTIGGDKIPEFIKQGATYLVSVNFDDTTNYWKSRCETVAQTQTWILIDLTRCSSVES